MSLKGARPVEREVRPPSLRDILQPNTQPAAQRRPRLGDLLKKLRMVLKPIPEPVLLRRKADEAPCRPAMSRDHDLPGGG